MTAQPIPGPLALADAPTPATLAARLLRLVTVRADAAATLEVATERLIDRRTLHDTNAADRTLRGLDGKNESERAAQLRVLMTLERIEVTVAENEQRRARVQLEQICEEISILKAVARLIGGTDA